MENVADVAAAKIEKENIETNKMTFCESQRKRKRSDIQSDHFFSINFFIG